jgi:hypothetical protein
LAFKSQPSDSKPDTETRLSTTICSRIWHRGLCSAAWHDLRGPLVGIRARGKGEVVRVDDEARDTIERFHEALNRRDLDALGDLITDDCVFETTSPAPRWDPPCWAAGGA